MSDFEQTQEVNTPDVTATPEDVSAATEVESTVDQQPEEKPAVKTFTQEELDAIVSKRLAREQRKWEREQRAQQPQTRVVEQNLTVDQFESPEAYAEALAEQKAQRLIQEREIKAQQAQLLEAYHDREEAAREKYADFEQVAYNPKLPITEIMAETIRASDAGPDLAYWLGSNPQEAARISRLSPFLQAKEIGKIEAKLSDNPPVKKSSSAPAPISPVTTKSVGSPVVDTTDPRSIKSLSVSEWIEAERQRQIKKFRSNLN